MQESVSQIVPWCPDLPPFFQLLHVAGGISGQNADTAKIPKTSDILITPQPQMYVTTCKERQTNIDQELWVLSVLKETST